MLLNRYDIQQIILSLINKLHVQIDMMWFWR